jgi:hypothetical protein
MKSKDGFVQAYTADERRELAQMNIQRVFP